ncbi:MAG: gfo/Idh/MocA family oxidoreductase [Planctomycetota bacterium]|nr:MAG: gfo/Idh/MocA family oxidoreductase [Planctomycetota bacterium]
MTHTPIGTALIGCGNFARWQHLPNLARLPGAQLLWLCDHNHDLVAMLGDQYDCQSTTDAKDVLTDPRVEAVVIAVRDDQQAELCLAALAQRKHVYVEKPVGNSPQQALSIAKSATHSGRQVAVGFQKRCAPAYVKAKQLLDADGGVRNLSLRMVDDAWRWASGYPKGALLALDCCHLFDLARFFCDSEVAEITARRSRPDDDAMLLQMENGAIVSITLSGHGTMDMPKERLDAVSMRGGVCVEDFCELRAYGYPEIEPIQRFAGASHPDYPLLPRYLLAEQGASGLASIRRIAWQLRQDQAAGKLNERYDAAEIESFITHTIPNFLRDQGWLSAMEGFLQACAGASTNLNIARAEDAWAAQIITEAALRSQCDQSTIIIDHKPSQ